MKKEKFWYGMTEAEFLKEMNGQVRDTAFHNILQQMKNLTNEQKIYLFEALTRELSGLHE